MARYEHTFCFCPPNSHWQSFSPYTACQPRLTANEKRGDSVPLLRSTRTICISYTPLTYLLTLSTILLNGHRLIVHPPWTHTFPPVFLLFHLLFHLTHLLGHVSELLWLERLCVVYGTWLYWTGWLLSTFVFSERLSIDLYHPTTTCFWLLMLERRNAWGIIVWEFVSRLDYPNDPVTPYQWRWVAFRVWCLLGTGALWGLVYLALAHMDGFPLSSLLACPGIMKLLSVSAMGGLVMICFWSFWTFQYRGVLWQKELRKGTVVWISEGVARTGDVE